MNAHPLSKKELLDSDFAMEFPTLQFKRDKASPCLGWTYEASAYHQPGNQLIAVLRIQH